MNMYEGEGRKVVNIFFHGGGGCQHHHEGEGSLKLKSPDLPFYFTSTPRSVPPKCGASRFLF